MKNPKNISAIGLMSGTSLDGLDIVLAQFSKSENKDWQFQIKHSKTISYSPKWLKKLTDAPNSTAEEITKLNTQYGSYLGEQVNTFCNDFKISKNSIHLIASHGHTVFHNPKENYTLQIGSGANIAAETQIKTICDFRTTDVALKGQGAPLVPIGDLHLFKNYAACINLGGFSNISTKVNNTITAYDICPVNIVLNHYSNKLGHAYDNKGELAKLGSINQELLTKLNELPYYKLQAPKSLGREWVENNFLPISDKANLQTKDILNTLTHHMATQIANQLNTLPNKATSLFTGGGSFNTFLIEQIKQRTHCEIKIPSNTIINYKEALIFAFLGVLRNYEQINTLNSVTGATKNNIGGCIYLP